MEKHETVTRTHGVIHNSPLHMNIYIYVHIRVCQQTVFVVLYGSENWTKKASKVKHRIRDAEVQFDINSEIHLDCSTGELK